MGSSITAASRGAGGAPCAFSWAGLLTTDAGSAERFYGTLFGWQSERRVGPDARGYDILRVGDEEVALLYEMNERQRELGAPTNWASFVSVADVDMCAALVVRFGGKVAIPP